MGAPYIHDISRQRVKKGIFQGDSLCPLLFCLALIPQTNMLKKQEAGCNVKEINKVGQLFYTDDLETIL
jgi:hypothetical protein